MITDIKMIASVAFIIMISIIINEISMLLWDYRFRVMIF